jgi:hypothetical protein
MRLMNNGAEAVAPNSIRRIPQTDLHVYLFHRESYFGHFKFSLVFHLNLFQMSVQPLDAE